MYIYIVFQPVCIEEDEFILARFLYTLFQMVGVHFGEFGWVEVGVQLLRLVGTRLFALENSLDEIPDLVFVVVELRHPVEQVDVVAHAHV